MSEFVFISEWNELSWCYQLMWIAIVQSLLIYVSSRIRGFVNTSNI